MVITSSPSSTKPSSKSKIRLPRKPISEGLDISCSLQGADGVDGLLVAVTDHLTTKSAAYAAAHNGNSVALVNASDGSQSDPHQYDPFGQFL